MSDEGANDETSIKARGDRDVMFTRTFETSCYDRILDCDASHNSSDDQLDIQSSALLRDAQLVDRPHEVMSSMVGSTAVSMALCCCIQLLFVMMVQVA